MARVGEFCSSNIARLLLSVIIVVTLVLAVGTWVFYSPGSSASIVNPQHHTKPSQ
jgi:hypothetical protein